MCNWFEWNTITFSLILYNRLDCILDQRLFGYIEDRLENDMPVDGERLNGFVCLVQALLLASFAAILASHRSEILDQKISLEEDDNLAYEAPKRTTVV